jgi:hypothetical protein
MMYKLLVYVNDPDLRECSRMPSWVNFIQHVRDRYDQSYDQLAPQWGPNPLCIWKHVRDVCLAEWNATFERDYVTQDGYVLFHNQADQVAWELAWR